MAVWLLLSCPLAKRERETARKGLRGRGGERWTFPLLLHLLFQPLTHFCCQHQLFLPIYLPLPSIFLAAGNQSLHSRLSFCRSSVTSYYFSSILCLHLLYAYIHLSLSVNLSIFCSRRKLAGQDWSLTERKMERERKTWNCEVVQCKPAFRSGRVALKSKRQRAVKVHAKAAFACQW